MLNSFEILGCQFFNNQMMKEGCGTKALKRGIIVAFCIFMYLGVNVKATTTEDLYSSYNFQKGISLYYDSFDPNELNWEALTLREQVETLSLPVEMVETLSTEELAKWALNYPLLADLFLFDNAKDAMSYFSRTSYLFQSLFERTDNISVLLNASALSSTSTSSLLSAVAFPT